MSTSSFEVVLRRGVWQVTLDRLFYGVYRSKDRAVESAEAAAQALREHGRVVQVVVSPQGDASPRHWFGSAVRTRSPKWSAR
jgi:hypothetical protein